MHIITPAKITPVAWEGEMVAPQTAKAFRSAGYPVITIGKPEIWPVTDALENQVGQKWIPPLGNAGYWLVRLACTLRDPDGVKRITQAEKTLSLHPRNHRAEESATYAFSLFPERLDVEDGSELSLSLEPSLNFGAGCELKAGQLEAKIDFRKVFPVIRGYGAGEPTISWIYQRHSRYPLDGSQFVYAVVVAKAGTNGIHADLDLTVTVEMPFGLAKFGLSDEARASTKFKIY